MRCLSMMSIVPDVLSLQSQCRTHIAGKQVVAHVPPLLRNLFIHQCVDFLHDMPMHARTAEADSEAVVIADDVRAFAFGSNAMYHHIT